MKYVTEVTCTASTLADSGTSGSFAGPAHPQSALGLGAFFNVVNELDEAFRPRHKARYRITIESLDAE